MFLDSDTEPVPPILIERTSIMYNDAPKSSTFLNPILKLQMERGC
jgi:hypothetical protein